MAPDRPDRVVCAVRILRGPDSGDGALADWAARAIAELTHAPTGHAQLAAHRISIPAGARTAAHHHARQESLMYILHGRAGIRWGDSLEHEASAVGGEGIVVPAWLTHCHWNDSMAEPLEFLLVLSETDVPCVWIGEATGIAPAVAWVDPQHALLPEGLPDGRGG